MLSHKTKREVTLSLLGLTKRLLQTFVPGRTSDTGRVDLPGTSRPRRVPPPLRPSTLWVQEFGRYDDGGPTQGNPFGTTKDPEIKG